MNASKFTITAVAIFAAAVLSGCQSIPSSGPVSVSLVSPQRDADLFWSSHSMGTIGKSHGCRVAIAQFAVEFVTERIEPQPCNCPNKKERIFRDITADFGEGLKLELPGMLCELLRQNGDIHFVPIQEVAASKAYAKFKGLDMGQKIPVRHPEDSTSDCGRPLKLAVYTVDGLKILNPDQPDSSEIMAELLNELKVDSVLRVKIRVGVFGGRATVEDESSIEALGKNFYGNLESIRTLISDQLVADSQIQPAPGQTIYHINSTKYCCQIKELFLKYMAMAAAVSGN